MVVQQLRRFNMRYYHFSEIGFRETNEDVIYCNSDKEHSLFMIADGMGGYDFGEIAARLATETISQCFANNLNSVNEELIVHAFQKAHNLIKVNLNDAGTTIGGIYISLGVAYIFWIGDVKIVLKNETEFYETKDHTLYNLLKDESIFIKSEEIPRLKNTVIRSLGGKSNSYIPEIHKLTIGTDFSAIICSDGVHSHLNSDSFFQLLQNGNWSFVLDTLKASGKKGSDNYSSILISTK